MCIMYIYIYVYVRYEYMYMACSVFIPLLFPLFRLFLMVVCLSFSLGQTAFAGRVPTARPTNAYPVHDSTRTQSVVVT